MSDDNDFDFDLEPFEKPKRKRKRKTNAKRAERQAERIAQADANLDKPIDPLVWILLGGVLLFIALFTWLDPVTLAEANQQGREWSWFQLVPLFLVRTFGHTPAVIIMTVLGLLPLGWGIIGWLRKRFGG